MRHLIRRLLGLGPTIAEQHCAALETLSRAMIDGLAEGLRNPGPPDPERLAVALAYAEGVAHRSFSMLYDDED